MSKCDNCRLRKESASAFDIHWLGEDDCPYDVCMFKTNGDVIRAMDDDDLAFFLADLVRGNEEQNGIRNFDMAASIEVAKDWLRQEAIK